MNPSTIFRKIRLLFTPRPPEIPWLYEPDTDSLVVRQLMHIRNNLYLDPEVPCYQAREVAIRIDDILRYIDSVDMELPRFGV